MRADARRNRELLIAAAVEAFAQHGADASLDDIARRAGVGPGTLYRHFPTRQALHEAAYREGVDALCEQSRRLVETVDPAEAFRAWFRIFVDYVGSKRGLSAALMATQDKTSELFVSCHQAIRAVAEVLLDNAKRAGAVRPDIRLSEVLRLANAIGLATEQLPDRTEQAGRMVTIVLDGLHANSERNATF